MVPYGKPSSDVDSERDDSTRSVKLKKDTSSKRSSRNVSSDEDNCKKEEKNLKKSRKQLEHGSQKSGKNKSDKQSYKSSSTEKLDLSPEVNRRLKDKHEFQKEQSDNQGEKEEGEISEESEEVQEKPLIAMRYVLFSVYKFENIKIPHYFVYISLL